MRGEPIKRKTSGVVIGVAAGVAGVTLAIVAGNFYNERHPQMAAMEQTPMPHSAPAAQPAPAPVDLPQSAPQTAPLAGAVGGKTDDNTAAVKPLSTRKPAAKQLAPVAPSATSEAPRDTDTTPMPIAPLPTAPPPDETPKE